MQYFRTALSVASDVEVVRLLLEAGAETDVATKTGAQL